MPTVKDDEIMAVPTIKPIIITILLPFFLKKLRNAILNRNLFLRAEMIIQNNTNRNIIKNISAIEISIL